MEYVGSKNKVQQHTKFGDFNLNYPTDSPIITQCSKYQIQRISSKLSVDKTSKDQPTSGQMSIDANT